MTLGGGGLFGGKVKADFRDISKMLKEIGSDKFIKRDVLAEQKKGAETFRLAAAEKVPIDTGHLKDQIIVKSGFNKKTGVVFATVGLRKLGRKDRTKLAKKNAEKDFQRSVGYSDVKENESLQDGWYGLFVEFSAPGQPGPQQAKPFMRPAFEENKQPVVSTYKSGLEARLQKAIDKMKKLPKEKL